MHFSLTNGGSGWIHEVETRFLVKEVHFLLTNGGLRWIHGIGTRFLVKKCIFIKKRMLRLDSRDWHEVFG